MYPSQNKLHVKHLVVALVLIASFFTSHRSAFADGMLYQLPRDGCWARFEFDGEGTEQDGTNITVAGTLTMSCVGTVEIDGRKCRWIEIVTKWNRTGQDLLDVDKLLILESHLVEGQDPLKGVVKAWYRALGDQFPRQVDASGPIVSKRLRGILHGSFETTENLEPINIENKLGSLRCNGILASDTTEEGGLKVRSNYTIRLNRKAPFGVVTMEMKSTRNRDGDVVGEGVTNMRLVDYGSDAHSAAPDAK